MKRRRRTGPDEDNPLHSTSGRPERRQRVVYIACEGDATEPQYLDYLNKEFGEGDGTREPFRIHPVHEKTGLLPLRTVTEVRQHAGEEDEAWVLFDRDEHQDQNIRSALSEAALTGIEVGFSHPSFDLWLLLHFQAFSGTQSGSSKNIVAKLRGAGATAFKDYDKRNNKRIDGARRAALRGREKTAVQNARALVSACEHGTCKASTAKTYPVDRSKFSSASPGKWSARSGHAPTCDILKRDPSTDVWRLLMSLGIVPGQR